MNVRIGFALVKSFSEVFLREASGEGADVLGHTEGSIVAGDEVFSDWCDAERLMPSFWPGESPMISKVSYSPTAH